MNFTHTYERQFFYSQKQYKIIDCYGIPGTHGYCDMEAANRLKGLIEEFGPEGIHFIDSGNYHYISKFWTDKIEQDYILVLLDHHTDMQKPIFGGLLSCGSWAKEVLDQNSNARGVVLIGPDEKQLLEDQVTEDPRVLYLGEGKGNIPSEKWKSVENFIGKLPVYISVDKDILDPGTVITDWDQGTMNLQEIEQLLSGIIEGFDVIGVDICGDCSESGVKGMEAVESNDRVNAKLSDCLMELL